jgi:hypothetical protein
VDEEVKRPAKKDKKKRVKGRGDLREYYDICKGKVLIEFNLQERRARGQVTYVFRLKSEEEVKEVLDRLREQDAYSKVQIDLKFHVKQMNIGRVGIIRGKEVEPVKREYPEREQTSFQADTFANISHDLFTFETVEKKSYERLKNDPILSVKKI